MFQMETTRTLEGKADTAAKVTLSVFGKESASGIDTHKVVYQGQLGNSLATLYTVPASTTTFITDMTVVNTDSSTRTFTLYVGPTSTGGAGQAVSPTFTLPIGGMANYSNDGWRFYDATGHILNTTT